MGTPATGSAGFHSDQLHFAGDKSHVVTIEGKNAGVTMGAARPGIRASNLKRGPVIESLVKSPAADALQTGCDGGKGLDCYELALVCLMGGGSVPKDDVKAAALFRKACEAGSGWGCMNLGDMYMRGSGVQYFGEAATWYRKIQRSGRRRHRLRRRVQRDRGPHGPAALKGR